MTIPQCHIGQVKEKQAQFNRWWTFFSCDEKRRGPAEVGGMIRQPRPMLCE